MIFVKLKLKDKIRNKLMDWLGVTDLDITTAEAQRAINLRIDKSFDDTMFVKSHADNRVDNLANEVSHNKKSIDHLYKTIQSVVHIGTDVNMMPNQNHSWAVICVEGNINLVKFIDLNGRDAREISSFLKQFEAGKHCIDTPYKILYDEMFKF